MKSRHFKTLIVAGLGSIGRSMFAVGGSQLHSFLKVVAVDRDTNKRPPPQAYPIEFQSGDITDRKFLERILCRVDWPVLVLNLCAGMDNLRFREVLSGFPAAYIDSCCCAPDGTGEYRFSRMMPYTLTPVESAHPHWVCWGINPGVVELVTRMLLLQMGLSPRAAEVTIFEHDTLHTPHPGPAAVGWCPAFLVEEMLLSPVLVVEGGEIRESVVPGGLPAQAWWGSEKVASWLVGHEDIWNLGRFQGVRNGRFIYGLDHRAMGILERRDPLFAAAMLQVPAPEMAVRGIERIAVQVRSSESGATRTLLWETDHERVWTTFGVNGVQFQTCISLWLAIRMLQHTRYGKLPGTWCASSLPITHSDWTEWEASMLGLGMSWEEAGHLNIRSETVQTDALYHQEWGIPCISPPCFPLSRQ